MPRQLNTLPVLDADYPPHERFPRRLVVAFAEHPLSSGRAAVRLSLVSPEPNAFPNSRIAAATDKIEIGLVPSWVTR